MQYPSEIPGITNAEFMRAAINAKREEDNKMSVMTFLKKLDEKMALLNMPEEMAERYLNEGFSGGEKKRNEILQLLMLEPTFAILDEIDSGLDIDALKVVDHHPLSTLIELHHTRCGAYHDGRPSSDDW